MREKGFSQSWRAGVPACTCTGEDARTPNEVLSTIPPFPYSLQICSPLPEPLRTRNFHNNLLHGTRSLNLAAGKVCIVRIENGEHP